jgi:hypothetical protein
MTPYLMFAFGFAAGAAIGYRDLPLAALGLACALGLFALNTADVWP